MFLSIGLHAAAVGLLAWLTLGGQGNEGELGNDLADETAAASAAKEQEFVMTLPPPRTASQQPKSQIKPKPVRAMQPTALKRLAALSPTAQLQLPELPEPKTAAPSLPVPTAPPTALREIQFTPLNVSTNDLRADRPTPSKKAIASTSTGKGTKTTRKAAGLGAGGGSGNAKLLTQLPRAISSPAPAYPMAARAQKAQGTTTVRVTVDESGHVTTCSIHNSSGNDTLDRAALSAVKRWRFAPGLRASVPIEADVLVRVVFRLA